MAKRAGALLKTLLILAIVAGVGYAVWWRVQSEKAEAEAAGGGEARAASGAEAGDAIEGLFRGQAPIPVKVSPVERGTLVQTVHAEGKAQPLRQVRVTSQVSGRAERILVREGAFVRAGQVLVELEDETYRLDLQQAQSDLLRARADYAASQEQEDAARNSGITISAVPGARERLEEARTRFEQARGDLAEGRISQEEFDDIELEYQSARILAGEERGNIQKAVLTQREIALKRAQRNLDNSKIKAPFAGRVANLMIAEGQLVGGSSEILTLLDLTIMLVNVDVLENEIAPIQAGREAKVAFTALPEEVFDARVVSVNPIIDPGTRTGRVTLQIRNPEGRVTSGMFARARIFARFYEDVNMVPLDALVERDERTLVFQVEPSTSEDKPDFAKWRYVQLGPRNDTHAVVLPTDNPHEGVAEGMKVCVEGHVSLQHDSYVVIVEEIPSNVLVP